MTGAEVANSAGSVAAISSPWWLPSLQTVSEVAAGWLPILGGICLGLQCIFWLLRTWRMYHSK